VSALAAVDLSVSLDGTPIVHEVSWSVPAGGWLALIGPNGAGKTTVLRAAAGLVPYRGTVLLGDRELRSVSERARLVAYVPQEPVLPPDMTVSEYVLLGRTPYLSYLGGPGRGDRAAARAALDRLQLDRLAGRRLATLSGGERKRTVLARALAQEPAVLLLDEPTSSLDIGHQQQVLDLVDDLRTSGGLTVLSTLHDLTTAGQYADQLVLIHKGRIEATGDAATVLTQERIARIYAARVTVATQPDGSTSVTPVRGLQKLLIGAGALEHGRVDGPGDPGAPVRPRPRERLRLLLAVIRASNADRVRSGARTAKAGLQYGLGLRLGRGDHGVHQGRVGQRHRHLDQDVDRPRLVDRPQFLIGHVRRGGRPGRHPQPGRGGHLDAAIGTLDKAGYLRGGQHAHAGTGQAEAPGEFGQVLDRIHPAVAAGHLDVQHPVARADTAAEHAAGDHPPAGAWTPAGHRQPDPFFVPPVQLDPHPASLMAPQPAAVWCATTKTDRATGRVRAGSVIRCSDWAPTTPARSVTLPSASSGCSRHSRLSKASTMPSFRT
jgi:iron complex transport system ATP-binding protein